MFISKTGFWQRQQWFLALFYRYSNVGIFWVLKMVYSLKTINMY